MRASRLQPIVMELPGLQVTPARKPGPDQIMPRPETSSLDSIHLKRSMLCGLEPFVWMAAVLAASPQQASQDRSEQHDSDRSRQTKVQVVLMRPPLTKRRAGMADKSRRDETRWMDGWKLLTSIEPARRQPSSSVRGPGDSSSSGAASAVAVDDPHLEHHRHRHRRHRHRVRIVTSTRTWGIRGQASQSSPVGHAAPKIPLSKLLGRSAIHPTISAASTEWSGAEPTVMGIRCYYTANIIAPQTNRKSWQAEARASRLPVWPQVG